jgi:hypothetical protein
VSTLSRINEFVLRVLENRRRGLLLSVAFPLRNRLLEFHQAGTALVWGIIIIDIPVSQPLARIPPDGDCACLGRRECNRAGLKVYLILTKVYLRYNRGILKVYYRGILKV